MGDVFIIGIEFWMIEIVVVKLIMNFLVVCCVVIYNEIVIWIELVLGRIFFDVGF